MKTLVALAGVALLMASGAVLAQEAKPRSYTLVLQGAV